MITRVLAALMLIAGISASVFVFMSERDGGPLPLSFGLDLAGGTHLVYKADTSDLAEVERKESLVSLREVIERRTNLFGVAEPLVQIEESSFVATEREDRLIVELPGVTDLSEAVRVIGETPLLEFRIEDETKILEELPEDRYAAIGLTGRFVQSAELVFAGGTQGGLSNEPIVLVHFNQEGADLFEDVTRENVGKQLAIFLDGTVISAPVIREAIAGGTAQIAGGFTPEEARSLVRDLNFGALPVPIELISTQSIGPSLGHAILEDGALAGGFGLLIIGIFMVAWYRLPGLVASLALIFYIAFMLLVMKLIPITLTAAGIAGLILSLGMAVDANVLIFERMGEELKKGKGVRESLRDGFSRAWLPIRDGNISSLIAAVILFWFGTSIIEGFALVFALGVLLSMFSAITITRLVLLAIAPEEGGKVSRFLFSSGIKL
ncbi:MAG: protein translocase subunit SecD [Patescibacteria group bacterium UBA2103]